MNNRLTQLVAEMDKDDAGKIEALTGVIAIGGYLRDVAAEDQAALYARPRAGDGGSRAGAERRVLKAAQRLLLLKCSTRSLIAIQRLGPPPRSSTIRPGSRRKNTG
jgi:hypothetical protein